MFMFCTKTSFLVSHFSPKNETRIVQQLLWHNCRKRAWVDQVRSECPEALLVSGCWSFGYVSKQGTHHLNPDTMRNSSTWPDCVPFLYIFWVFSMTGFTGSVDVMPFPVVGAPRNAHDISSVVAAFATIEYAHKSLFKALQRQPVSWPCPVGFWLGGNSSGFYPNPKEHFDIVFWGYTLIHVSVFSSGKEILCS